MVKELLKEVKTTIPELRREIKELKDELKIREWRWEKESNTLKEKIEALESRIENNEKARRRNNIVIKGLQLDKGDTAEEVEEFMWKELKVKTSIRKAYKVGNARGKNMVVAEVDTWYQKKEIMKAKSSLKGIQVYIDNDLTQEEWRIQKEIVNIAKEEKKVNPSVRITIGYKKLIKDGVLYTWDEKEQALSEAEHNKTKKLAMSNSRRIKEATTQATNMETNTRKPAAWKTR